jgi:anaerobic ribonucleoside-triphosphate reductase activating protein
MRTCVWVQGCALGCQGCVNRNTWDFTIGSECPPELFANQLFSSILPGTRGITISGGEPMHQACALLAFCRAVKRRRPGFSLGMFTGYTLAELDSGDYLLRDPWPGTAELSQCNEGQLWRDLYPLLDFVVAGRYDRTAGPGTEPLCSTANQRLILPTSRYTREDFQGNVIEYNFEADGLCIVTGIPIR